MSAGQEYIALTMRWLECVLNHGLQNIRWLNTFFAGALTGHFGAWQLLAYFKFLKLTFNKKRGNQPERELSSCFGQALLWEPALPSPAGQGAARAGGRLAVGGSHGRGLLSIPHPMPGQRRGSAQPPPQCYLPPVGVGQRVEAGSWLPAWGLCWG